MQLGMTTNIVMVATIPLISTNGACDVIFCAGLLSEGLAAVLHHRGLLHLLAAAEALPVQVPRELGLRQEKGLSWHSIGKLS